MEEWAKANAEAYSSYLSSKGLGMSEIDNSGLFEAMERHWQRQRGESSNCLVRNPDCRGVPTGTTRTIRRCVCQQAEGARFNPEASNHAGFIDDQALHPVETEYEPPAHCMDEAELVQAIERAAMNAQHTTGRMDWLEHE